MPTWRSEIFGGATTFLTMAYIVFVNPAILSTEGTGMPFAGVLSATVLLCFSMTLLMGLYAKLPFAVAPGMGINSFFAFSLILGEKIPWQTALGMVFWSGVLFLAISLTPMRVLLAKAIPHQLRIATAGGIGIFLAFIGLKNMGLITSDPATFVKFAGISETVLLSLTGLLLSAVLLRRKNPLAFLAGIFFITLIAALKGWIAPPSTVLAMPDFHSVFLQLDLWGALKLGLLPPIAALLFTDLFDSISTFIGVSHATGLCEPNGDPRNLRQGLIVDAWATLTAGLFGTSSGTAYIESAAGIEVGARSGRASIVTALLFLPCFFLAPLAQLIPIYATAPVLILVGGLMFRSLTALSTTSVEDTLPAYLTVILIPLTFSITQGILWGLLSHVILYTLVGRKNELSPMLVGVAIACVGLLSITAG